YHRAAGGQCILPLTDWQLLWTGIAVPLICVGFFLLNFILHVALKVCYRRESIGKLLNKYARCLCAYAIFSFNAFAETVFTFFNCTTVGDITVMTAHPV